MGTVSKFVAGKLLDPTNAGLNGQARVNAEIFTAMEILGRKLERVEAERNQLARRLALIESAATVDEDTGKFYLPVATSEAAPSPPAAASKWAVAASLMSSAVALFALGVVLFRTPAAPVLTADQIAALDALRGMQFAQLSPESKNWQHLEVEPSPRDEIAAAEPTTEPAPELPAAAELQHEEETAIAPTPVDVTTVRATPPESPADITLKETITPAEKKAEASPVTVSAASVAPPKEKETPKVAAPSPALAPAPKMAEKKTPAILVKAPEKRADDAESMTPDPALPESLAQLEKRAYQGVPEAQHDLATLYASGKVLPQNYKRAIHWFTKSADGGVANAHYNLGVIYHQGLGVAADMQKAMSWYEKAAELGHPEAMYNLGIAYIEGVGTKTNVEKGVAYFKRAAKAGVAQAAYNLGVLYESNFIGPVDAEKAASWYQVAAKEGHSDAAAAVARLTGQRAESIEPAAGEEYGEGDASPITEKRPAEPKTSLLVKTQQELIRQGLLPGPADGLMTPQTEDAIASYQKKLGMPEDGLPSEILLKKMIEASAE